MSSPTFNKIMISYNNLYMFSPAKITELSTKYAKLFQRDFKKYHLSKEAYWKGVCDLFETNNTPSNLIRAIFNKPSQDTPVTQKEFDSFKQYLFNILK